MLHYPDSLTRPGSESISAQSRYYYSTYRFVIVNIHSPCLLIRPDHLHYQTRLLSVGGEGLAPEACVAVWSSSASSTSITTPNLRTHPSQRLGCPLDNSCDLSAGSFLPLINSPSRLLASSYLSFGDSTSSPAPTNKFELKLCLRANSISKHQVPASWQILSTKYPFHDYQDGGADFYRHNIVCGLCRNGHPTHQYSNGDLEAYRVRQQASAGTGRGQVQGPICRNCIPSQPSKKAAAKKPAIPDNHARCSVCEKTHARMKFSNIQWGEYESRSRVAANARKDVGNVEGPKCRKCQGEPPESLVCWGCHRDLPRISYTRAQRQKKDLRVSIAWDGRADIGLTWKLVLHNMLARAPGSRG